LDFVSWYFTATSVTTSTGLSFIRVGGDTPIQAPHEVEFRAWQIAVLSVVGAKAKSLSLPGGYAIFSQTWACTGLGANANNGIGGYRVKWAGLLNLRKP